MVKLYEFIITGGDSNRLKYIVEKDQVRVKMIFQMTQKWWGEIT